jgi:hypothetical protein
MLGKTRWLAFLMVAFLATTGLGLAAGADSATESQFLSKINATRAANGLGALTTDGGLTAHARNHSQQMMDADGIFHSTSGELAAAAGSGWAALAENVGRGGTVESLHTAFMESAGHRKNILGDYNYVGIGTGTRDGRLYVTVVFMRKGNTPTPTTEPAPATTAPDTPVTTKASGTTATTAKQTTTTSTAPPTTTTTMDVPPDKPVTPGESCVQATRFWQLCHD